MKLNGNTILITGGATGIGLAFAKKFAELGNKVIIAGRRQDKLDEAVKGTPNLVAIKGDVGDTAGVKALAQKVLTDHPDLNVLMNNAGIMRPVNLAAPAKDLETFTTEIDINLAGPIRLNAALIEHLLAKKGTIINVSSGLAYVPLMGSPIYCATKAAMHSYTVSLRNQLTPKGIEVIEVMPPAVKTELSDTPDGVKVITTDELVADVFSQLKSGKQEIRTGQANQLHWMSRVAPGFITGVLAKGSVSMVPAQNN